MDRLRVIPLAGLVVALLVLAVGALYNQRPTRKWKIRWLNFLGAVVFLWVGSIALLTGRITERRHSVTLIGAPAAVVGSLFVLCGVILSGAALTRREPQDFEK